MPMHFKIKGLCAAPGTPFSSDGKDLNCAVIPHYVSFLRTLGFSSVFANGTLGEGLNMTIAERKQTAEAWIDSTRGVLDAVIVHVGTLNLKDSQELAAHAESYGASAVAAIPPCYYKPHDEEQLCEYLRLLASAAPKTPFIYYDFLTMTNVSLNVAKLLELCLERIPTFSGIKYTTGDLVGVQRALRVVGDRAQVMLGNDQLYFPARSLGVEVPISVPFCGRLFTEMNAYWAEGNLAGAREKQLHLLELYDVISKHANPNGMFAVVKAMTRLAGIDVGPARLPITTLDTKVVAQLKSDLNKTCFGELVAQ